MAPTDGSPEPLSPRDAAAVLDSVPRMEQALRRRVRATLDLFCGFVALLAGMGIAELAATGAIRKPGVGEALALGWATLFAASVVVSSRLARTYALDSEEPRGTPIPASRRVPHDVFLVVMLMGVRIPALVTFGADGGLFPRGSSVLWDAAGIGLLIALVGAWVPAERGDRILRIASGLVIGLVALGLNVAHVIHDYGTAYAVMGVLIGLVMTTRGIVQVLRG